MKKSLLLSIVMAISVQTFSQVRPEAYVGLIPAIPNNICSMSREQIDNYLEPVETLLQQIDEEQQRRDENIEANIDSGKGKAMQDAATEYGLSQADIQKLQSGNLSETEKMAIANKMAMQKYNVSVTEVQNVSNMSTGGKEAWSQAYATEQMANAQADPATAKTDLNSAQKQYDLTMEQKHLNDSLMAIVTKFSNEFEAIRNDPEGKTMLDNIDRWNSELMSMTGIASDTEIKNSNELQSKIKAEKELYCSTFTPRYTEVLRRYESFTKASLSPYYILERLTGRLTKLQTGMDVNKEPGAMGIASIKSYLVCLKDIFMFNLQND
jgi:hypothetical protein